jgi:hypothetical protein
MFFTDAAAIGYYNKGIPFWDLTVMIFVCKLVLGCLINNIKYIFILYSAHISEFKSVSGNPLPWIQVSKLRQLASANVYSSPTVIPHYHNITSIHISKFNLSSLLITVCTTNVLFFANVIAGWMLN